MSACDRLVALLRAAGRAVLVGGPTEGAGGSQQETTGVPARWTDRAGMLSVSIPNAAFGVPRTAGAIVPAVSGPAAAGAAAVPAPGHAAAPAARAGEVPFETFFDRFAIENRPVEPDVRYEPGVEDVTAAGRAGSSRWTRSCSACPGIRRSRRAATDGADDAEAPPALVQLAPPTVPSPVKRSAWARFPS
jgi:hypothetical protein